MKNGSHAALLSLAWMAIVIGLLGLAASASGDYALNGNLTARVLAGYGGFALLMVGLLLMGINLAVSAYRSYALELAASHPAPPPAWPHS